MSPVVLGSVSQPRTIVITPSLFCGDENTRIVDSGELPKYAVGLFESNGSGPRKRKRLTHLTPEEKIMRRKLKNRVAAQTARDRKKARMETLEDAVSKIHDQMNKLLDVNSQLMKRTQNLEEENMVLRRRLGLEPNPSVLQEVGREISIIKKEFDVLPSMDSSQGLFRSESSDDESGLLTSYEESSVDNEVGPDVSTQQVTVCRSPVPAAFGERVKERLIPQQQEAVKPVKLIHSETESKETSSNFVNHTETQFFPQKKTQTSPPSLGRYKPSILNNVLLRKSMRKEMPLDLRIR